VQGEAAWRARRIPKADFRHCADPGVSENLNPPPTAALPSHFQRTSFLGGNGITVA
jgi:hypothetical protein